MPELGANDFVHAQLITGQLGTYYRQNPLSHNHEPRMPSIYNRWVHEMELGISLPDVYC